MDLAACFIKEEFRSALDAFLAYLHVLCSEMLIRTSAAEFSLLESTFRHMAARAKQPFGGADDSGWAKSGRVAVPPPLRRYFVSALWQPLFVTLTAEIPEAVRPLPRL